MKNTFKKMNNAKKYISKKMKNTEFKQSLLEEKLKIDLEFMIDELNENIKNNKPKEELLISVSELKRAVAHS